ncbi:MAG: flavodoxin domain-containing protein [Candidatus Bathyarchaeota archaeon]
MDGEKRTLIAYMTSGGVTKEYAEIVAETLREKYGHNVELVDIRQGKKPDPQMYDFFVVGSGVRAQRVYRRGLEYLRNDFGGKPVAVFLSSNEAGTEESYPDAVRKYMNPIKEKHDDLNLVAVEGFGGRIRVLGKTAVDTTDPEKVRRWAEELGQRL